MPGETRQVPCFTRVRPETHTAAATHWVFRSHLARNWYLLCKSEAFDQQGLASCTDLSWGEGRPRMTACSEAAPPPSPVHGRCNAPPLISYPEFTFNWSHKLSPCPGNIHLDFAIRSVSKTGFPLKSRNLGDREGYQWRLAPSEALIFTSRDPLFAFSLRPNPQILKKLEYVV